MNWIKRIQAPIALLAFGILTRCVVYIYLSPHNNDGHISVVEFLVKYKKFPPIADNMLAFHPPLYYLMAAPVLALLGSDKAVQFLSLIISIGTLIVLYRIIYKTELIASSRARLYSFLLACFLPQFVMFGLYISNDSLTFFLGCLTILQTCHYLKSPDWKNGALLAAVTGLGLLTKTTFLVFLPILLVLVIFVRFREHRSFSSAVWAAGAFLMISGVLGSYKYVDNYARYKNPLINSLDTPRAWATAQKRTYHGARSYLDFDIRRLVVSPSASSATTGSYPLLLYGTFWYQHIPESNFFGAQVRPYFYLGSVIYLVALVPTTVFVLGLIKLAWRLPEFVRTFDRLKPEHRGLMGSYVAASLLAANAALVIATIAKYHVWALMQGRYLFPTLAGGMAVFAVGVEMLDRTKFGSIALKCSMIVLVALFGLYLSTEVGYLMVLKSSPGIRSFLKALV